MAHESAFKQNHDMHMNHFHQLTDLPLIDDEEKRVAFRLEFTQLINRYSIDNACDVPDYLLTAYLESQLLTLRALTKVRDCLHPPRPIARMLDQFPKTVAMGVPCANCDGKGFILPIEATDAPTLQRWMETAKEVGKDFYAPPTVPELTHLEIDATKLSAAERAQILHHFDWSDEAPDTPLQRAGRKLLQEAPVVTDGKLRPLKLRSIPRSAKKKGGGPCSQ